MRQEPAMFNSDPPLIVTVPCDPSIERSLHHATSSIVMELVVAKCTFSPTRGTPAPPAPPGVSLHFAGSDQFPLPPVQYLSCAIAVAHAASSSSTIIGLCMVIVRIWYFKVLFECRTTDHPSATILTSAGGYPQDNFMCIVTGNAQLRGGHIVAVAELDVLGEGHFHEHRERITAAVSYAQGEHPVPFRGHIDIDRERRSARLLDQGAGD